MHIYAYLFIVIENVLFVVFIVKVLIFCFNKQARLISQIGKQRLKGRVFPRSGRTCGDGLKPT